MAIAFSAVPVTEERVGGAPSNKVNTCYTRTFEAVVPASSTAATLPLGFLAPGTVVLSAVIDTDTSFGATATLALATGTSTFVVARKVSVTGGEACAIAANKAVAVPTSATADAAVNLVLAAAASPASVVTVRVTLVCSELEVVETYVSHDV